MRAIKAPDFGYNLKSKKDSMKRGEKEAISLLRRRRLKFAVRMMSFLVSSFIILSSIYFWRTGQISLWIAEAESVMGARMIDAGLVFEEVRIKGQTRTKTDEIKNIFYEKYGQPLLDIDIKQVKNNVEQLTWVKNAMVTRKLPGALEINIIEYYPSALWQMDNKL
ncbi:MAG: FtsQ-type POTRA domain-containing protein [Proteobacteria bacterium]|nr:FtsQ-type POTRA domain-containing protein [Pseudomonadota bacterium]